MSARAPRGQALVETVLGVTMVCTVILVGIFFAETGYWSLKIQEALNFAMWDATGRTMHTTPTNYGLYGTARSNAVTRATNRYGDYDGVRSRPSGTISQVVTQIAPPDIFCSADTDGPVAPLGVAPIDAQTDYPNLLSGMPGTKRKAGMRCNAKAALNGYKIPGAFLQDKPYHASNFNYATSAMTICAIGRASGSSCASRVEMFLDDYGLSTSGEGQECPLSIDSTAACSNTHYYNWVKNIFNSPNGNASSLASVVGAESVDESQFFMSYRGYEDNYVERLDEETGTVNWETSPHNNPGGVSYAVTRWHYWLGNKLAPPTLH